MLPRPTHNLLRRLRIALSCGTCVVCNDLFLLQSGSPCADQQADSDKHRLERIQQRSPHWDDRDVQEYENR